MTGERERICERSDLPESMCSHCRGLPWRAVIDIAGEVGPAAHDVDQGDEGAPRGSYGFRAEFASNCPSCGEEIRPGDHISKSPTSRQFVCVDCADNDQRLR